MINRIKKIAQHYKLTSTAFADLVEIPRPVISHIFSERNRPSLEVIQKIGMAFQEVELEWLLYGKGEMLKKSIPFNNKQATEIVETIPGIPAPPEVGFEEAFQPEQTPETINLQPHLSGNKRKRTVKIVFIYEDNSFEEFWS